MLSRGSQLEGDELLESLQVLGVQLDVIVPGALHPQRFHGTRASLVDGQAVREIDHLVLCAMNHEDRRGHLWHLINAEGEKQTSLNLYTINMEDI